MSLKVGGVSKDKPARISGPGAPAHGDLGYNGGPTISCPRIYAAFWGPHWQDATHQAQSQRLIQFLKDLIASDWMNILSQYGGGTGKNSGVYVTDAFAPNVTGTLSDGSIHATLQAQINNGSLPEPQAKNTSDVVIIYLDETVAVRDPNLAVMCEPSGDNAFGYHNYFTTSKGNNCYYAVIPSLSNSCIVNTCPS